MQISIGASSAPATHSFSPETPGLTTSSPRNSTLSSSRPVTTDLIARRLVAGALGLKLERREGGKDLKESQKIQQVRGTVLLPFFKSTMYLTLSMTEKRDEEKKRLEQREQDLSAAWDE